MQYDVLGYTIADYQYYTVQHILGRTAGILHNIHKAIATFTQLTNKTLSSNELC